MPYLISPMDLTVEQTNDLLALADRIMDDPKAFSHACEGKKLATLFFEPSTRTRLSFEAAMLELGGQVLGFSSASSSSASKGETAADTARVVSCYADIIAMRHPKEGAATAAAAKATVPIINAGDGGHHHPTQTLTDLLTIHRCKGGFEGLTIGLCGDLKFGRTVHSLIKAMCRYQNVRFLLVSPPELRIPGYLRDDLTAGGFTFREVERLEDVLGEMDVLYMTRVQQERFTSREEYESLRDCYILDGEKMKLAKPDAIVLHPLPRVSEIAPEVDDDPRAKYFEQVLCGKYVRMALILTLLGLDGPELNGQPAVLEGTILLPEEACTHAACVTQTEPLPHLFRPVAGQPGLYRCAYCDQPHHQT